MPSAYRSRSAVFPTFMPRALPMTHPEPPQPENTHPHSRGSDSVKGEPANHDHASGGPFGEKAELIFAILGGVLLATGWMFGWQEIGPAWLPTALYAMAYLFGGWLRSVHRGRNRLSADIAHGSNQPSPVPAPWQDLDGLEQGSISVPRGNISVPKTTSWQTGIAFISEH